MANVAIPFSTIPFSIIPEDLQLCILSFLSPPEISSFACTSKHFASLCHEDGKLWHALCHRKWGTKTQIQKWGHGQISYRSLYKTLIGLENLIGFWRLCGRSNPTATASSSSSPPSLVVFEWGPCYVLGSRVFATTDQIKKTPFLLMGVSSKGRVRNLLDLDGSLRSEDDLNEIEDLSGSLAPVDVNFMGSGHIMVEEYRQEHKSPVSSGEENEDSVLGTSPDFVVSEIYTQLANKTSPGGERRRQRRKEKERRIKWEAEHFIKVVDCLPTSTKPLQGLWKGFCEGRNMELYLVKYDEVGGIVCRKVEDLSLSRRQTSPVFWTSNLLITGSPLSVEEELILNGRIRTNPLPEQVDEKVVSGMLYMNSSYDLSNGNALLRGEGRVWLYEDGTFGFGFVRDHFIIDLKRVAQEDGHLADDLEAL